MCQNKKNKKKKTVCTLQQVEVKLRIVSTLGYSILLHFIYVHCLSETSWNEMEGTAFLSAQGFSMFDKGYVMCKVYSIQLHTL